MSAGSPPIRMMAMRERHDRACHRQFRPFAQAVAPFGGREARLGTNPISIAVPSDLEAPFYLDMATSAVAAGKIQLAAARGEEIPRRLDRRQRRTSDHRPRQFRKGGALLPLGGTEGGYKGSGLAAMVEVLCGLLTGLGFGVEPTGRHNDGCFMAVFNVAAFRPLKDFKKEVAEFARYLKATPTVGGLDRRDSIRARSNISVSSSASATASTSKIRLGINCSNWPKATVCQTSSNLLNPNNHRVRWDFFSGGGSLALALAPRGCKTRDRNPGGFAKFSDSVSIFDHGHC